MLSATYASLRDGREAMNELSDVTADDMALLFALRYVTQRMLEELPHTSFLPRLETHYYDPRQLVNGGDVAGRELYLDRALLEVVSIIDGDGSTLAAEAYTALPRAGWPKWSIRLNDPDAHWAIPYASSAEDAVAVTGVWGCHSRYPNAWLTVDSVQDVGGISANATTVTVAAAASADPYGRTPRLSPGMLLRIDDEYLAVMSVTGNAVSVVRGQHGTTAAAHAAGAAVKVWLVEPTIALAAARWASYVVKRRGEFADSALEPAGVLVTRYPKDMPHDVAGTLKTYWRPGRMRGV